MCAGITTALIIDSLHIPSPAIYVIIASVAFALYQVILLFVMLPEIVNEFWPISKQNQGRTTTADKWIEQVVYVFFLCSLFFEIYEGRAMENTIGELWLFWYAAALGIVLASIITLSFKKLTPTLYMDNNRRIGVHFGLFIGYFLFIPALASFINETYCDAAENCESYNVIGKGTATGKRNVNWLYIDVKGTEERFEVSNPFYNSAIQGSSVQLCTQKGALGYDVVKEFKLSN